MLLSVSLAGWLVQREFDERVSEEHGQQQPAASDSKGLQSKILHAPSVDVHPRPAEPCPWRLCTAVQPLPAQQYSTAGRAAVNAVDSRAQRMLRGERGQRAQSGL